MSIAVERTTAAGLLVVSVLCCLCISRWTADLERANADREERLRVFRGLIADPHLLPPGPVAALDGLFVRRVVCRVGPCGPRLWFEDAPGDVP